MGLKINLFNTARELTDFVNDPGNSVSAITAIVFDGASGKYVLFYT